MNEILGEEINPFIEHPATLGVMYNGARWRFSFTNGYGASVIQHDFSYGGNGGLWEVAVLDVHGMPTYDTPIADDVIGRLTVVGVRDVLDGIARLPSALKMLEALTDVRVSKWRKQ